MNDSYPYSEFLQDMTDRLFKKVFAGGQLSEYDQLLESTYVTTLCRYFRPQVQKEAIVNILCLPCVNSGQNCLKLQQVTKAKKRILHH